jgi:uncharacterized membrane protein
LSPLEPERVRHADCAVTEVMKPSRRRSSSAARTVWPYLVVALILGWVVPRITHGPLAWFNPDLGTEQVIAFLGAVSSGMMAFTGIVFALLFILLQFGSATYSPHIVPLLTRGGTIRHAGGIFTGTFVFSLMALRGVGALTGERTPALVVWTAFVWLLASVIMLVRLVDVFSKLEMSDVLELLSDMGHAEIERMYGGERSRPAPAALEPELVTTQMIIHRGKPKYVTAFDVPTLVAIAKNADVRIRIDVAIGDSVCEGASLATVEGRGGGAVPEKELREAIRLDPDRTYEQGPKHAMRLLVDIAIRALSPAINDPTTAVHAIDKLEGLLRRLAGSDLDVGAVRDAAGELRVVYPAPTWEELVDLCVTEIQYYGAGAVQVERRLAALFVVLRGAAVGARKATIEDIANEHLVTVRESFPEGARRRRAEQVDRQGLGHTQPHA